MLRRSSPMPDSPPVASSGGAEAAEPPAAASAAPAAAAETADIIDPSRSLRTTLRGLATLVAPTSVVTSLLYYFGWTRASRQSQAMGFHVSLLGFSTQDYVLQSLAPMFWPLLVGLLASIGGLLLHGGLLLYASRAAPDLDGAQREERRRQVRRLAVGLAAVGAALAVLGVVGASSDTDVRLVSIGSPLAITASIVLVSYAIYLSQRFRRAEARRTLTPELRGVQLGLSALVVLLLLLSLFWSVSNYAENKGVDLALRIERDLSRYPDVTIYSAKRLYLPAPAVETALDGENGAYRFRYTRLKFLYRTKSSYWLRPDVRPPQPNIFLADSPDVRFEFSRAP